ncbi:MAG TPA: TfoX/Sxy family protein [Rhizomicrobium sp.]|jgi:DNA transformation protein|nr:TfoX/Sxy family protein [Rhizomicrobium sp.]
MAGKPDPNRFDDLFASFGKIMLRRMFGGEGIYSGQAMLGLVFDERIFLKTSDETRPAFIAEGASPFTYTLKSDGVHTSQKYYALPDRLYDDPDELAEWVRAALASARKTPAGKKKPEAKAVKAPKQKTKPAKKRR